MTEHPIQRTAEVVAYRNRFVTVYDDEVTMPGGVPGRHLRIEHATDGPGVVVVPLYAGSVGLVRTYRYPLGQWQWGLPRGFAHAADPLVTAKVELREELGLNAAELRVIGSFTPDSGLLSSRVVVVLARLDSADGTPEDTAEVDAVRWIRLTDLPAATAAGELTDGMSLAALSLATATGDLR